MFQQLKLFLEDKVVWMRLLVSIVLSFVLAIVVTILDARYVGWVDHLPQVFLTSSKFAQMVISTLAGSLFSVATFTFGTILTVLSFYASNFSPRIIENFLFNKVAMQTLSMFLGGFVYCLTSLFLMRESQYEYLVLSGSFALIYAFACVYYFVRFIYSVSHLIQQDEIVRDLFEETQEAIYLVKKDFSDYPLFNHLPEIKTVHQRTMESTKTGYIEYINFDGLHKLAQKYKGCIVMTVRIGDFIAAETDLAVFHSNMKVNNTTELRMAIENCLTIQNNQTSQYDYKFGLSKIVDVGLRAASPSTNDPNSVIEIIRFMTILLGDLAEIPGRYMLVSDSMEHKEQTFEGSVFYDYNHFTKDIYESFWQLITYVHTDLSIVITLYDMLYQVARRSHKTNLAYLKDFVKYLDAKTKDNFPHAQERSMIDQRIQKIHGVRPDEDDFLIET